MMSDDLETERLLADAGRGDGPALQLLLSRHRDHLRRMIEIRMDRRLTRRVDPSDIVQMALADVGDKLGDYLQHRPLPFYPWLRRLASERLIQMHRYHLRSQKRSVGREEHPYLWVSDDSAIQLVDRLVDGGTSPSGPLVREECRRRLLLAMEQMSPHDRELLVLRYLEELPFAEVAAALGLGLGAVKMRHLRALQRLRTVLGDEPGEE